ncbi:MAG: hypothetical protein WC389_13850 [Lutibacter sp.]|jgi:predicted CopG family antitoxin
MSKLIKISDEAAEILDNLKHEGQSYDGLLKELLRDKVKTQTQQLQPSSTFHPVPKPNTKKGGKKND